MNAAPHPPEPRHRSSRAADAATWLPGLLVALGAGIATAHGLFEVVRAAGNPAVIAALYPLITDGLATAAYVASTRLTGAGRRYAWTVVVLAAGVSGLAQASYLANGIPTTAPGHNPAAMARAIAEEVPAGLRFGIGAWPAIAAAIVAHLLFLIAAARRTTQSATDTANTPATAARPAPPQSRGEQATVQRSAVPPPAVQTAAVQPPGREPRHVQPPAVHPAPPTTGEPVASPSVQAPETAHRSASGVQPESGRPVESPARDAADTAAHAYLARHGELPTVTRLVELAGVSRGTAGEVLKTLRNRSAHLHIVQANQPGKATS